MADAPDLDAFLAAYRAAETGERAELLDRFVQAQRAGGGFPVADDGEVAFLYRGDAGEEDVRLVGDFRAPNPREIAWDPEGVPMQRVAAGADLWIARLRVEPDARLDYAFAVDGERRTDPLNPRRIFSGVGGGEVSELVMPGHRLDPALDGPPDGATTGTVRTLDAPWATPAVRVYLPPGYDPGGSYPVVYTADGSAWIEYLRLPRTLDALIAAGRVEPLIAVMIDAAENRRRWYYYNPDYLDYLARVVAHVDATFATRAERAARLHAGTSAGGRAALLAALERADLFAKVAPLSPSIHGPPSWWRPWLSGERRPDPELPLELWTSVGTYEGVLVDDTALLADLFRAWGHPVTHVVTPEGHSFGAWRNHVPRMLEHFFPAEAAPPG